MTKKRLDAYMVENGLAPSRERAQAVIMSGIVYIDGQKAEKPSAQVEPEAQVEVRGAAHDFVSRGALKLDKALDVFGLDVHGVVAMDLGASTGGFTDVLLRRGCRHVYAVDVGYGQLDWRLRNDPRVTVMERTNARYLKPEDVPLGPTLAVMDVSFISITKILPAAAAIMGEAGAFVSLIKPQFEAGRERVGKKGVVRDPAVHADVIAQVVSFVREMGWRAQALSFSPITGPEGNIEFLVHLLPAARATQCVDEACIAQVVAQAHAALE